jgi:hypothetical protein
VAVFAQAPPYGGMAPLQMPPSGGTAPPQAPAPGSQAPEPQLPGPPLLYGTPTLPYGTPTLFQTPTLPLPITIPSVRPVPLPELPPGAEPPPLLKFRPDLVLAEQYSNNFNFTPTNTISNFRTSLAPGGVLFLNDPTITGSATASLPITYDSSLDEVRLFYSLAGQVSWQATPRFRLTASDNLVKNDSPAYADSLGLQVQRNTYWSNIFALESAYELESIGVRAYYQLSTFSNQSSALGNNISNTVGASATVKLYEINTAALGYQYLTSDASGDFPSTDTQGHVVTASLERKFSDLASGGVSGGYSFYASTTGGVRDNFQIGSGSVFAFYSIPGTLSLRVSAGFGQLLSESQGDRSIFTGALDLIYSFGLAQLTFSGSRGFAPTFGFGQNFGVVETQGVGGSLFYPFTPYAGGSVGAFYRENIGTGIGTAQAPFSDRTWGVAVTLSIQLLRWLNLDLNYGYADQTSTNGTRVYTENHGGLALIARFY